MVFVDTCHVGRFLGEGGLFRNFLGKTSAFSMLNSIGGALFLPIFSMPMLPQMEKAGCLEAKLAKIGKNWKMTLSNNNA